MTQTKPTAGPVVVLTSRDVYPAVIAPNRATICMDVENDADAKLIAAAPDLLAACEKMVDYRRRVGPLEFQLEKCDDFIHMMKVAITAATGTQSEGESA